MPHFWTNYHSHSNYCDGSGTPEEQVLAAIQQGVKAFGFSSHCPIPFENKWSMKAEKLENYLQETRQLKEKYAREIELYTSLEIDYVPDVCGIYQFRDKLDYTIGSIHYLDKDSNGKPLEIDGSTEVFMNGLAQQFDYDIEAMLKKYYSYFRRMVTEDKPDIVGHLDKIKIHNIHNNLYNENEGWYKQAIEETLSAIAAAGCIIEINTRGIYKKNLSPYPSLNVLQMMKELNIPITINADSHQPSEITRNFVDAVELAQRAGYQEVTVLLNGQWQNVAFDKNGLKSESIQ